MKSISIFGLGYVGATTAACLASRGHKVIGVDPNRSKVERIQNGMSPIVEAGVQEMISSAHERGLIAATHDSASAIADTEISFVCVGTPGQRNGKLDLSHIRNVSTDIGESLRMKNAFHWILVRSTVLPTTTETVIVPAIEMASGKKCGRDFLVCFNPEFLREGTAVDDFFSPPFTIVGTHDPAKAAPLCDLYSFLSAPLYTIPLAAAEMIKYSCNAFHALKVAFANEIGTICSGMGVDPKVVSEIFKSDTRLNISSVYLSPGFAFGGSCLSKDLRALIYRFKELDLKLPLLESILPSNTEHIDRAAETVLSLEKRRIGVVGLSFKPGTDDLRESPMVHLVKKLIAEGCDVRIWDEKVSLGHLIGSNRQFIESTIPHIGTLLQNNLDAVVEHAEILVVGTNPFPEHSILDRLRDDQYVINLAKLEPPFIKDKSAVPVRT